MDADDPIIGGVYFDGITPNATSKRCPSHHYMTGLCCQLDVGHAGPCLANAGLNGELWIGADGKHHVYAWHQPPRQPACAQTRCANPSRCECALSGGAV